MTVYFYIIKGGHFGTFVDSLLVDVGEIDQLAWDRLVTCINVLSSQWRMQASYCD